MEKGVTCESNGSLVFINNSEVASYGDINVKHVSEVRDEGGTKFIVHLRWFHQGSLLRCICISSYLIVRIVITDKNHCCSNVGFEVYAYVNRWWPKVRIIGFVLRGMFDEVFVIS